MMVNMQMIRREGLPIPRWQIAANKGFDGDLVVREEHDKELHRTLRVACLNRRTQGAEPLMLYDPMLIASTGEVLVLTGIERVLNSVGKEVHYSQTWWLRVAAPERPVYLPSAANSEY